MKFFTAPALLASALFSVVVVIPFLPSAQPAPRPFAIEARVASSVAGVVKIYYDVGEGYRESDSAEQVLQKSDRAQTYRFPLPAGMYRSIRLDPADGPGTVVLESDLRLTSSRGRLVRAIPLTDLQPLNQIESLRSVGGKLEIVSSASANDPHVAVSFRSPLHLVPSLRDVVADVLPLAAGVFVGLALVLLLVERTSAFRTRAAGTTRWLFDRPARAIALIAAVAVTASAYPVIFLGKSHVSPNFGTTLLYEAYPTLPGYTSTRVADSNGSDVGAIMWAHVPYAFMQRRALAAGELPLWNRYSSTGAPLLAQGQTMFGDPLHLPVILANGAAWAWDVKYLVAKFLFALALGLTVFALARPDARREHAPEPPRTHALAAALIVAFAAPFIGFFVYRINHPAFFSLCYAPWVLYCWLRIAQAVGRRSSTLWIAGLFVANIALLNSGTVKEAYLLVLQMNAAGACVLLAASITWRERLAKLAGTVFSGVLLILITAPVWQPFLQTVRQAFTAYSHPIAYQIQPSLLLGAFDELFFRPLSDGEIVFNPALNVLLLIGLLYFVATLRVHSANRPAVVLGGFALITLAFSFGVVSPNGIARIPLLANVAHIENCFLCGFIVLGSVLAGIGFATAARRLGTRDGRADLMIVALLFLTLVGAWLGFRQASHRMVFGPGTTFTLIQPNEVITVAPFIWGALLALLLASVLLAFVVRQALARQTLGAGGAILAALCVLVLVWRQGMHAGAVGFPKYVVQPPARAPFHDTSTAVAFVQAGTKAEPSRSFGLHGNLTPGWNAAYGLEAIYGPDALQNHWLRELIAVSPLKWSSSWRLYCAANDVSAARPFLDALNVRYYLDRASNQALLTRTLQLAHTADLDVYESPTTWPRAFFTDRIDVYDEPADLMKKMLTPGQQPFAALQQKDLTAPSGLASLSNEVATRSVVPATTYTLTENTTSFHIRTTGPGVAVLTEAWWPDSFRAEIDGQRKPVVRINHAFKGVVIDTAGDHVVKFSYWPRKYFQTLLLSGAACAALIASLALALRPARAA